MGFNINDFMNEESRKAIKNDWKPVKISVKHLRPAPEKENFYHADDKEITDLAKTIELIGLQQYPVVKAIEGTDDYEIIAGHKRRLAHLRLLDEGKEEFEMIPCKVETPDSIKNELILIFTNSTQRERTDYEKMREIERVRELLTEYQKTHELTGRKQNIIAEILGTNKTKVGTLDNINNNLIEPFKAEFAAGKISTSTANEIAGLEHEAQQVLFDTYKETGTLTAKDAKAVKAPQEQPEPPAEPPKEAEATETPKEPEKEQETSQFMNELTNEETEFKLFTYGYTEEFKRSSKDKHMAFLMMTPKICNEAGKRWLVNRINKLYGSYKAVEEWAEKFLPVQGQQISAKMLDGKGIVIRCKQDKTFCIYPLYDFACRFKKLYMQDSGIEYAEEVSDSDAEGEEEVDSDLKIAVEELGRAKARLKDMREWLTGKEEVVKRQRVIVKALTLYVEELRR